MNIVNSETNALAPDTFGIWQTVTGPRTVVFVVAGEIDIPETLRVRVYGGSDLVAGGLYLLEDATVDADPSNLRGYQTVPIPLADDQWTAMAALEHTGGSVDRTFTVVAIEL